MIFLKTRSQNSLTRGKIQISETRPEQNKKKPKTDLRGEKLTQPIPTQFPTNLHRYMSIQYSQRCTLNPIQLKTV